MHKKIALALLLLSAVAIAGCGNKQPMGSAIPTPPVKPNAAMQQQAQQDALEDSAPKTTNDLPTAINETEKDLQVIDNDLKEIDNLNLNENDAEL